MTWYERIIRAHRAVTDAVSHFARMESSRYFVWSEDGSADLAADNDHGENCMTGRTDLFTKQEFDPWADEIGRSFSREGIAWSLVSVDHEEETGFIHYSWDWEVC